MVELISTNSTQGQGSASRQQTSGASYFEVKWTYKEYLEELKKPIEYPDRNDENDPRYYRKYAHNISPPDAYYFIPDRKDSVANDMKNTKNDRRVYFGWKNITQFELDGMQRLKNYLASKGAVVPPSFEERDWLKWIQASFYDVQKAGDKLFIHFGWLDRIGPEPRLTNLTVRLLQSGCFYLHGRDKLFRPCFVMDGAIMAELAKTEPDLISAEAFNDMFTFMWVYVKKVILLPGQVEQWITICDLNNMSMTALPRKQILAFGSLCQANLMYFLFRSFYTHVGWGQRLFYKGVQVFIDDETKLKIVLAADGAPQQLVDMFHPSQLETRFGGTAPTPTNFWPPFMGKEVVSASEKAKFHPNLIRQEDYDRVIAENPELNVHPLHMKPGMLNNNHFVIDQNMETQSSQYNLGSMQTEEDAGIQVGNTRFSNLSRGTERAGTIYYDADNGFDEEEERKAVNQVIINQIGPKLGSTKTILDSTPKAPAVKAQAPAEGKLIKNENDNISPRSTTQDSNYGVQSGYKSSHGAKQGPISADEIKIDLYVPEGVNKLPVVPNPNKPKPIPPVQDTSCCACRCEIF